MEVGLPKDKNYIAEGNVIISFEEYNKLNEAMEQLKKDRSELISEQNKLNKAIKAKLFLTRTIDRDMFRYSLHQYDPYIDYDLSKEAEKVLEPILEQGIKEKMKDVYKEFSSMTWRQFIQWRKDYKEK